MAGKHAQQFLGASGCERQRRTMSPSDDGRAFGYSTRRPGICQRVPRSRARLHLISALCSLAPHTGVSAQVLLAGNQYGGARA